MSTGQETRKPDMSKATGQSNSARAILGEIDSEGVARFAGDIDACRQFLRGLGLECERRGWEGNGMLGSIEFHQGEYHAQAWKSDLIARRGKQMDEASYLDCVQAVALSRVSSATYRQKSDLLAYIRHMSFDWEGDGISVDEAASRAVAKVLPVARATALVVHRMPVSTLLTLCDYGTGKTLVTVRSFVSAEYRDVVMRTEHCVRQCRRCSSAPWECRSCGWHFCEHLCTLKTNDGKCTCQKCAQVGNPFVYRGERQP